MGKLILIICLCSLFKISLGQQKASKVYKLTVHLEGANFTSLSLRDYRDLHNIFIPGKNIDQFKWQFLIPDTIAENSESMELIVPDKDTLLNGYRSVRFYRENKDIKNFIANVGIQNRENLIAAKYVKSTIIADENLASLLGKSDTLISGNLIIDDFVLLLKNDESDIAVRSLEPYYCWFDKNNITYDKQLASYIQLAKSYPDSRYLITYLSLNLVRFKTREDVKKIYRHLSQRHRESKWAKRIDNYLSNNMESIKLLNLKTNKQENLVQDSSRYNLLIFSASWCGPCIQEMPLLKRLYDKLNTKIAFTTISLDYETKVKEFQSILNANKIDWRILYAYDKLETTNDLYSISSIPLTILVYPNGRMERLDVRDDKVQKRLYELK